MEQTEKKSFKLVWIVVASLGVFLMILGVAVVLLAQSGTTPQTAKKNSTSTSSSSTQAITKEDIKKNLDDLNSSLKEAASDQSAAKAALDDSKNQIKLGS